MLSTGPFVPYQSCEHGVLQTNKPMLLQIGTSGPWGKHVKRSTLVVVRSKVKVTGGQG